MTLLALALATLLSSARADDCTDVQSPLFDGTFETVSNMPVVLYAPGTPVYPLLESLRVAQAHNNSACQVHLVGYTPAVESPSNVTAGIKVVFGTTELVTQFVEDNVLSCNGGWMDTYMTTPNGCNGGWTVANYYLDDCNGGLMLTGGNGLTDSCNGGWMFQSIPVPLNVWTPLKVYALSSGSSIRSTIGTMVYTIGNSTVEHTMVVQRSGAVEYP